MAIKVLVIDDEPDVATIFRQKFRRRVTAGELEFVFAENGRIGLDRVGQDPEISLIFTDIRMPTMDGLTLLKELKSLDRRLLLPIVVSAYDDLPNLREAMRQGAWDFVTKPIDLDDLERVCDKAIAVISAKQSGIEAERRAATAEAERNAAIQRREAQQEFFENVTHELRTPLTLMLAPLASAEALSSEPQVRQHLRWARQAGGLLRDTIDQLLDLAKAESHRLQASPQATDLTALLGSLALLGSTWASQKQMRVTTHLPTSCLCLTDPRLVGRIVLNLLSNAIKYAPEGTEIRVQLIVGIHQFQLVVEDEGPGISTYDTQDSPLRFLGFGSAGSTMAGNSGLGLSIAFALAETLGGGLTLDKEYKSGCRFLLEIPLVPASEESYLAPETNFHMEVSNLNSTPDLSPADKDEEDEKPTVLIAEDHPDMRNFLRQMLQADYEVLVAENGRVALDLCRKLIPDLVVTDWMMPELDGIALVETLRLGPDTRHIPIVMLTAKAGTAARLEGISTGMEAYLEKPFEPQELLTLLHNLLSQRERLRERFRTELLHPERHKETSMEDQFAADVHRIMEKHLMDEQFGVELMADELAMSRRTLVRKLSAVTGQPPVKFIRAYRLERARQMLEDHTAPIWEIAVKTGFGSASYFTKCYKDHYGISPREAAQREA